MVIKRTLVILTLIVVVSILGACVRSASTPPVGVITPPVSKSGGETTEASPETSAEGESLAPPGGEATGEGVTAPEGEAAPTNEVLAQLQLFVTQTAAAAQIAGGQAPAASEMPAAGAPAEGTPAAGEAAAGTPGSPAEAQPTQAGAQAGASEAAPAASQPAPVQPAPGTQATPVMVTPPTAQAGAGSQSPAPAGAASQPPAQVVVPTATPGIPSTYTVQTSEFVFCIARRYDVNPYELMSINGLSQYSVLKAGMVLKMPKTGHDFPGQRALMDHPTTYTVKSGENIYEIACKFGDVSPEMIAYANGLSSPYSLTDGQQLYIP